MTQYEKDHLTVTWDESLQAVVTNWHESADGDDYREGLDAGLELARSKTAPNWLADRRALATVAEADQEWTNRNWLPRALDSQLDRMSIVRSEADVAEMAPEDIAREAGGDALTTHYFDDRSDAEAWLKERLATV
jgi:hypothetical protein